MLELKTSPYNSWCHRGFAFLRFCDEEVTEQFLTYPRGHILLGTSLNVRRATPRQNGKQFLSVYEFNPRLCNVWGTSGLLSLRKVGLKAYFTEGFDHPPAAFKNKYDFRDFIGNRQLIVKAVDKNSARVAEILIPMLINSKVRPTINRVTHLAFLITQYACPEIYLEITSRSYLPIVNSCPDPTYFQTEWWADTFDRAAVKFLCANHKYLN